MSTEVRPTFLVVALFLAEDEQAFRYFSQNRDDLDATSGRDLPIAIPESGARSFKELFDDPGCTRYPGLERGDLPCLWIEDQAGQHFVLRIGNRNQSEIRDLLRDIIDAAVKADSLSALEGDITMRQDARKPAQVPSWSAVSELIAKAAGQSIIQFNNVSLDNSLRKEYKMGDEVHIGSITGSNVNFKSKLRDVTQNIGSAAGDDSVKADLSQLIQQLTAALEKAPKDKKDDAETIAEAATDLVGKATREQPNKKSIAISAKGLVEAAKAIAEVVPIATSIVGTVTKFVGGL